jgi:hypothetical protein
VTHYNFFFVSFLVTLKTDYMTHYEGFQLNFWTKGNSTNPPVTTTPVTTGTPRKLFKMDLILCSMEYILKMQFSMTRKFILQLLQRSNVKLTKLRNFTFDAPYLEKTKEHGGRGGFKPTSFGSLAHYATTAPHVLCQICQMLLKLIIHGV